MSALTESIKSGAAQAVRVLAARAKVSRRRAKARRRPKGTTVVEMEGFLLQPGAMGSTVLVAEGDSWFDYPMNDVLKSLEDDHDFDVESVAHRGDRIESMAYDDGQLDDFVRRIEKLKARGVKVKAVLLSGGGNDIAGEEFGMLLNHARSPTPGLNAKVVEGVLQDRILPAYATILAAVTQACEGMMDQKVPILIHGYDHPVPDGRGFLGGWGPLPGPWLAPGFETKRYDLLQPRVKMMKDLIDQFNEMVKGIAGMAPFAHVRYVDLRGSLSNGADYKRWWGNELHPTGRGFEMVAGRFAQVIATV